MNKIKKSKQKDKMMIFFFKYLLLIKMEMCVENQSTNCAKIYVFLKKSQQKILICLELNLEGSNLLADR